MSQVKASEELVPQERLLSGDDCELFRGVWFRSFGRSHSAIKVCMKRQKELKTLEEPVRLRHVNILQCLAVAPSVIVSELCPGGSLFEVLRNPLLPLDWLQRARVAKDVACAMAFVHQKEIVLEELTSHHVLLSRPPSGKVMVAKLDINYAGCGCLQANRPSQELWRWCETPCDAARSDVFAYGSFLVELLSRKLPYQGLTEASAQGKRCVDLAEVEEACPAQLVELMRSCQGHVRPTSAEVHAQCTQVLSELEKSLNEFE